MRFGRGPISAFALAETRRCAGRSGGKGGVGKSTSAAAIAWQSAKAGYRTLLVSTDPAHNVGDIFNEQIGGRTKEIADNLYALEIDPEIETENYIKGVKNNIRGTVHTSMMEEVNRQLDTAKASPGADEAALFDKLIHIILEERQHFDKLVFDTVDLHYLREQRAAELENRPELARLAEATRRQEIGLMRECDLTVVVSPVEQAILAHDAPGVTVDVLSNVHEVYGCRAPFGARHDLVFVGGFRHPPNEDAVLWYAREVHPRVRAALPDVTLHVVGSEVTAAVQALAGDGLIVHGFVDDLAPLMDRCRISIAPLRYGAGVKGKVNMAMSYGLPVVATPMAVEGMHVQVGEDVLVAADAEAFAIAVVALYRDEALWNRLSRNGLANVERHFSFAAAETAIRRIVGLPGLGDRQAPSRMP